MEKYSDDAATTNVRKWGDDRANCCSVVANQLLIYKGIASSERFAQILSACEPGILEKGAGNDQDPYEIPAEIRDLTAKSVEEARQAFKSFIEARSQGNRAGGRHRKRPAIERQGRQREGAQLHRSEFEGGVRSCPEAHSSEGSPGNPRPSVRIREKAARRHGGACEGAGHRCPEGRDAGQVITPFILQGQPNGNPAPECYHGLSCWQRGRSSPVNSQEPQCVGRMRGITTLACI